MIIRKTFKFEAAHIVRDCTTSRCRENIHGHSFIVEILLSGFGLDHGGMVMDFSLFKPQIGEIIDGFDHSYIYWNREEKDYIDFVHKYSERWIELPLSPSAESLAIIFAKIFERAIRNTKFMNGEKRIELDSVIVHETRTGYAQASMHDVEDNKFDLNDVIFSRSIIEDWKNPLTYENIKNGVEFVNPKIEPKYSK